MVGYSASNRQYIRFGDNYVIISIQFSITLNNNSQIQRTAGISLALPTLEGFTFTNPVALGAGSDSGFNETNQTVGFSHTVNAQQTGSASRKFFAIFENSA